MSTPLLTIIIPVYNTRPYLERCVRSVMGQSYQNLEILLVDDGSTDGSGALCEELAGEDGRIRVLHKENGGSSSARNLAIQQARGEYLGFVDSDDYIDARMYELLCHGILQYQVPIAQIGRDEIDEEGRRLPNICEPPAKPVCYRPEEFLEELMMHRGDCSFCTKLFSRELFNGHLFPIGELNEDFWLLVQMLPGTGALLSLPEQAYHVYYRLGSNSRRKEPDQFSPVYLDGVRNADRAARIVDRYYPQLQKTALRFGVFQRLEYLLHIPIPQMRRDNRPYRQIVGDLRRCWWQAMKNPCLTRKNKCYHTLFALAPAAVRKGHRWLQGMKS